MGESGLVRRSAVVLWLAALLLAIVVVPGHRAHAATDGGDAAPAGQVADGLNTVKDIAADAAAAAGQDKTKAARIADGIEAVWSKIEDTVRANDKGAYLTFEDNFDTLGAAAKAGDAKKATSASDAIAAAVKAYLAKFPAAPAPASAAGTAAAPKPGDRSAAAAAAAPASGSGAAAPSAASAAASAPGAPATAGANLARTGPHAASGLTALAGAALGLGGLALIVGARRRRLSPTT